LRAVVSLRIFSTSLILSTLSCFCFWSCVLLCPKAGDARTQIRSSRKMLLPPHIFFWNIEREPKLLIAYFGFIVFKDDGGIEQTRYCFIKEIDGSVVRKHLVANRLEIGIVNDKRIGCAFLLHLNLLNLHACRVDIV